MYIYIYYLLILFGDYFIWQNQTSARRSFWPSCSNSRRSPASRWPKCSRWSPHQVTPKKNVWKVSEMWKGPWMAMGRKCPFFGSKFPRNIHGLWCLWWFLLSWSTAKFVHFLPQLDPAAPASFPPGDSWSDPFPSNQTLGPGSKRPLRVDRGTSASFLRPYFPVEHERSSMVQHFVDLPQCFPKWYKIIPCLFGSNISWLVVSTPLKNISQLFTLFPIII